MEAPPAPIKTACHPAVMDAIYGPKSPTKSQDLEKSMQNWWHAYSSRKMTVPEEEYAANQLLYDPTHLPGSPAAAAATPPAK